MVTKLKEVDVVVVGLGWNGGIMAKELAEAKAVVKNLTDVETLCDRVSILRRGEVVVAGKLRELLDAGSRCNELVLTNVSPALREAALASGKVTAEQFDSIVDPLAMVGDGVAGA